jgi:hypothetical protein
MTVQPTVRAWHVAYGNIGMFSVVGESQMVVAHFISDLRKKFASDLHDLVPVQVMTHQGDVRTVYLFPALFEGVFDEQKPEEAGSRSAGPGGDFMAMIAQAAAARAGAPAPGEGEDVIVVSPPAPETPEPEEGGPDAA